MVLLFVSILALHAAEPAPAPAPTTGWIVDATTVGALQHWPAVGNARVGNLAGSCYDCQRTEARWDHVRADTHGCDPLPAFIVKAAPKAVAKDPRYEVPAR